ncbi:MAG: transketolase C-terminal domain-containing protein, partial [Candidatus Cloacimonetes bacterium]|nr:transketolase C-terminal domain-containing protein [Candidatus Cloacimonadota bacterium]
LAQETASIVSETGINPIVINLRSIKPLDHTLLNALGKSCSHVFTFENGAEIGGVGSRIQQLLQLHNAKVINFGYPDHFISHGATQILKEQIGFVPSSLAIRVLDILNP